MLAAVLLGILTSAAPAGAATSRSSGQTPSVASAVAAAGSYGCATDTIASTKIKGVTYTATEKTCVEILSNFTIRTHGVTRCYRSGAPFKCLIINGDSVIVVLWIDGAVSAGTREGDQDCSNCQENSHYSTTVPCLAVQARDLPG